MYSLTFSNGFSQLINQRTHIETKSSSCIDLIFTAEPNLSVNSGVHSSLHKNCHHQIVHTSFNPLSANLTKWTNTLKQFVGNADELFECVWPFCEIRT